jgi:hypothetical protein
MSKLYTEALERINRVIPYQYNHYVCKDMIHYMLEVLHQLANEHKSVDTKMYKIIYYQGNIWREIDVNQLRIMASNKYELLLKFHHYLTSNTYWYNINYLICSNEIDNDFIESYQEDPTDYNAMKYVIDELIETWMHNDTLWFKEQEDFIII